MNTYSDDEIKAAVTKALEIRSTTVNTEEFDTVVRLVRGQLRLAIGEVPLGQVAQKLTDLLLDGRRNMPPDLHRPQLRPMVQSAFTTVGDPVPPDATTETLVTVAIGWMIDHGSPIPPGARIVVVQNIVNLYRAAAN